MKPKATREQVMPLAQEAWRTSGNPGLLPSHFILAVRGYWPVSMGPTPGNDAGIFDDAWFLVTPTEFIGIPANTDPSRYGWNANAGKPMAVLQPGFWPFYRGAHRGKTPALRQYTPEEAKACKLDGDGSFKVCRTYAPGDSRNYMERGYYAINCHSGSEVRTSSEGCQTCPASLFQSFMNRVWNVTRDARISTVWYGLVEGPIS